MLFSALVANVASAADLAGFDYATKFASECDYWLYPMWTVDYSFYNVEAGKTLCIVGSVILGANTSFKATAYFPKISSTANEYEESKEIENHVAVVGKYEFDNTKGQLSLIPVTKIKPSSPLRLQYVAAMPSLKLSYKANGNSYTAESNTFVSTARKDNVKLSFHIKSSSKRADALYSISNKNLTYKFNRDKEVTIQTNRDILGLSKPFTDYEGTVGTYKGITIQPILSAFDTATDITTGKITFSFSGDVKLSWEEAAASSADQNEEFYFPEFTTSLTTKSGIFTKDDVDVKYPSGLPWWAILLIVIAVIIVIAIIVVVIILVIKKKKDKSSSSSSKKKNAEADGAA